MGSRSICFQAGPYRGWVFALRAYAHRIYADVQPSWPAGEPLLTGGAYLGRWEDGYDQLTQALEGAGRESMERGLAWLLEATAGRLSDTDVTIDQDARTRWDAIVEQGRTARAEYADRYGDGPKPPFEVIGCAVAG
ncbi:hypothetical protein AB0B10_25790 [Micromonospora arborensis]|uniref:hypothetical protein n=1 Tax=Micromonospora arborensis TaxID=2116518 RepID=UPI0033E4ACC2